MSGASGRSTTRRQAQSRATILAVSDICWLCGHGGAMTADHIIPPALWPPGLPGVDDPGNLAPAHGTMGSGLDRIHNHCPVCWQLCNQSRGDRMMPLSPRSEDW